MSLKFIKKVFKTSGKQTNETAVISLYITPGFISYFKIVANRNKDLINNRNQFKNRSERIEELLEFFYYNFQ